MTDAGRRAMEMSPGSRQDAVHGRMPGFQSAESVTEIPIAADAVRSTTNARFFGFAYPAWSAYPAWRKSAII